MVEPPAHRGAQFAVEANRRPHPADPEFDPSPPQAARLQAFDPLEHQRLIVNPFLAVLGLIGLARLAQALFLSDLPFLTLPAVFPLILLPYLVQYHCLDCGRTGPYPRRRGHACEGVLARHLDGRRSRFPFPTSWAQLVVWGWMLGAVAVLLAVAAWT